MYRGKPIAFAPRSLDEKRLSKSALVSRIHDMKPHEYGDLSLSTKAMAMFVLLIGRPPPGPAETLGAAGSTTS